MADWFSQLWIQVEDIAKRCQCNRILITGRQGWKKQMKMFNFEQKAIVLEKVL